MLGPLVVISGLLSLGLYLWKEKKAHGSYGITVRAGQPYRYTLRLHKEPGLPGSPLPTFSREEVQSLVTHISNEVAPENLETRAEPNGDLIASFSLVAPSTEQLFMGTGVDLGIAKITIEDVRPI